MGLAVASPQSAVFALILGSMSTACADVVAGRKHSIELKRSNMLIVFYCVAHHIRKYSHILLSSN